MKNRIVKTLTVLCAALICMGGFSVTAFAQGTEQPAADATNDSNVKVEQKEETPPLTPDGNATLVDDFGGNKQLITVTTKSGNYFYILIDRDDEGENTVHFLNQVDEADLMALMEDENGKTEEAPAVCTCTDKCEAGAVNLNCPVCGTDRTKCAGKEAEPKPQEEQPEPEQKNNQAGLLLIVLVIAGVGGGTFYYFKILKPKQAAKGSTDLEDFDFDEYDGDEPEAEDGQTEDTAEQEDDPEDSL